MELVLMMIWAVLPPEDSDGQAEARARGISCRVTLTVFGDLRPPRLGRRERKEGLGEGREVYSKLPL